VRYLTAHTIPAFTHYQKTVLRHSACPSAYKDGPSMAFRNYCHVSPTFFLRKCLSTKLTKIWPGLCSVSVISLQVLFFKKNIFKVWNRVWNQGKFGQNSVPFLCIFVTFLQVLLAMYYFAKKLLSPNFKKFCENLPRTQQFYKIFIQVIFALIFYALEISKCKIKKNFARTYPALSVFPRIFYKS